MELINRVRVTLRSPVGRQTARDRNHPRKECEREGLTRGGIRNVPRGPSKEMRVGPGTNICNKESARQRPHGHPKPRGRAHMTRPRAPLPYPDVNACAMSSWRCSSHSPGSPIHRDKKDARHIYNARTRRFKWPASRAMSTVSSEMLNLTLPDLTLSFR